MENLAVFYKNKIIDILNEISEESVIIKKAAKVVAESIAREELVHVIGPGGIPIWRLKKSSGGLVVLLL
jgi:uncharacterized phosphosugar-binding protein